VGSKNAFCVNPGCNVPTGADYDLGAKGDIVRARLTIKTQGYGFYRWSFESEWPPKGLCSERGPSAGLNPPPRVFFFEADAGEQAAA
jgi:hypothetical protein